MMTAPALPDFDPLDVATAIANRRTPLGELAGASIEEGFWSGPGALIARARQGRSGPPGAVEATDEFGQPINTPTSNYTEEAYRQGPWFREGLAWDQHLTEERARVRAEYFDENQYRRWLISQRESGAVSTAVLFGGSIIGSLPDPLNFIPFTGPAFRAAAIGRVGMILGRAATTATDALIGQVIEAPFVYSSRAEFGDDITFADILTDLATGALAGAVLGGAAGVYRTFRPLAAEPVRVQTEARAVLSDAAQSIAMDRPINVDPALINTMRQRLLNETSIGRAQRLTPEEIAALPEPTVAALARESAFVPAATKDGRPFAFDTLKEAESFAARRNRREGDTMQAIEAEDGKFVLVRRTESDLARSSDGTPVRFDTERSATRAAATIEAFAGAHPVRLHDGGWGLFRGTGVERAGMAAAPQYARFPRADDRSAGASIAAEQAAARLARARGEAEIARMLQERPIAATVIPDALAPDAAARIKQAESAVAGPRPRTVEERAADLGLERESGDLDAAVKELEAAGRLAADDAAAIKAAREATQDAEKTARAVEAAAMCRIRS